MSYPDVEIEIEMFLLRHNASGEYVSVIERNCVQTTQYGERAMHFADRTIAEMQANALRINMTQYSTYTVVTAQTTGIR